MATKKPNKWSVYALASGFVFETITIIALGFLAGYYLDKWLHTDILFTVILMLFAVFYSVFHLIQRVNKMEDTDGK